MSSSQESSERGSAREVFAPILRVLKQFGGYFTFGDESDRQFVIILREEFDRQRGRTVTNESQLPLPAADRESLETKTEEMPEEIGREIAEYEIGQQENRVDDLGLEAGQEGLKPAPPGRFEKEGNRNEPLRVRFEPLKGDLPPELQE